MLFAGHACAEFLVQGRLTPDTLVAFVPIKFLADASNQCITNHRRVSKPGWFSGFVVALNADCQQALRLRIGVDICGSFCT